MTFRRIPVAKSSATWPSAGPVIIPGRSTSSSTTPACANTSCSWPATPSNSRDAYTLLELLVVVGIIAVLLGLLMPAVQHARAAADRTRCAHHLRQIGIGLHAYHLQHGRLPPGQTLARPGEPFPYMGWLTRLLPYVEQEPLWRITQNAYDFDRRDPFRLPHLGIRTPVLVFGCPSDDRVGRPHPTHRGLTVAVGSYLGVSGLDHRDSLGTLVRHEAISFGQITDGLSQTVVVGERPPSPDFWYGWWYASGGESAVGSGDTILGVRERKWPRPYYADTCDAGPYSFRPGSRTEQCDLFHFWSLHPGGGHFLLGDGSAHFFAYTADSVLPALATRAGADVANWPK